MLGAAKKKFPALSDYDKPIDAHLNMGGHRLLGESTTLIGIVVVLLVGIAFSAYSKDINHLFISIFVYVGHAFGSFLKRRFNIVDGGYVPVIDHGDYILAAGIFCWAVQLISLETLLIAYLITVLVTPLVTLTFYRLGLRENKL